MKTNNHEVIFTIVNAGYAEEAMRTHISLEFLARLERLDWLENLGEPRNA